MPLFQNSVLEKYIKTLDKDEISRKWILFKNHFQDTEIQNNIRNAKEEQYQEGFLRDLFVNILGYTLNPQSNFNLTTEHKNVKDSRKADGAIIIDNKVIGVIELKGTNTTDLKSVETQAFGYLNNQTGCVYVITSNFEKIRFYINNAIEYFEFNLFTLSEQEFNLLYLCLSYNSISNSIPIKIKEESLSQEDTITKKLYKDYSEFKHKLYYNLVELNPEMDKLLLFKKSQKLIDRLLFILFGEDRGLLPPNSIREILKQWKQLVELDEYKPLYDRFKKYFNYLNTGYKGKHHNIFAYNGGLFKSDEVLDNIKIDDELLYKYTLKLSDYDYNSEVDVNILGHIFENSLNELDELKSEIEGQEIDKSKTKRKKDGVFYTPKYITKYIVENTVGNLCNEKKKGLLINEEDYYTERKQNKTTKEKLLNKLKLYKEWLLNITIIDPACGSGAFLNEALNFLIEEHKYVDELEAKLFGDDILLQNYENSILENNLFGVDVNEESVEIAKLSLWLRTAKPNRKLNSLNENIKCGNSLIDNKEIAGEKAFNWQEEFPKVFENGGFDIVIGNPPYVDIKKLNNIDVKYYFSNYVTCENRINLYSIFIEKGLKILNDNGILSFINPNSMLVNSSYLKLRKLIIDSLDKVVKLPDNVFSDAKVETIIFELNKRKADSKIKVINYSKNEIIVEIDDSKTIIFDKKDWELDANLTFNLYVSSLENSILNKIEEISNSYFEDIADFSLGITPYDKYRGHSEEIIKQRQFHSTTKLDDNYKPLINGENITRFFVSNEIKEYIKYGDWLGAKREEKFFNSPRILIRQIISGKPPRIYAGYTEDNLYFTQIGFGLIPKDESKVNAKYILCILNSQLTNFYHKYKFLDIEKELFQKILIANCKKLPIIYLDEQLQQPFIDKADLILSLNKELQELINSFVRSLGRRFEGIELSNKLKDWHLLEFKVFTKELAKKKIKLTLSQEAEWEEYFNSEKEKTIEIKNKIDLTDREIDKMVYELYGLNNEEIAIIEGR